MNNNSGANRKKKPTGDYPVGYCRPPREHQFPKRVSGNPSGRPSRRPSQDDIAREMFHRRTTVRTSSGEQRVQMREALLLAAIKEAMKGDVSMIKFLLNYSSQVDQTKGASTVRLADTDVALLADLKRRIEEDAKREAEKPDDEAT